MLDALNQFFHARAGPGACILSGCIRVAFGFLILCDRLLLSIDFDYFFMKILPYDHSSKDENLTNGFTIFKYTDGSPALYYALHILTMVQAVLLMMGIAPKFQLVCLHFLMCCFHFQNARIWDGEDVMFRVWNFLLLFLPLHRVTVFELFGSKDKNKKKEDSWPMWPFRLWQLEICFIYLGAGFGKLSNDRWLKGTALYHVRISQNV